MTQTYHTSPFSVFEWMLAFRYLRAKRQEGFISVIAVFSFLGIMLGVATLIIVMAVMNGFHNELLDKVLGLNGHVIAKSTDKNFTDYSAVAQRMAEVPGVKTVIPLVEGQAMVSTTALANGAMIRGLTAENLQTIEKVKGNLQSGSLEAFGKETGIVIGARMAQNLNIRVGDFATLVAPRGASTPFGVAPRVKRYPVLAIFKIGMAQYDSSLVFMPLFEAQRFFSKPRSVNMIEVMVDNPEQVDRVLSMLQAAAGENITLKDWRENDASFFNALQVERNVMFLILFIILIVAAFNIISGIIMLVKDKGRDIAVLRTIGASKSAVMRIFLITGASIGIVGTLIGFLLGLLVCLNIEMIQAYVSAVLGTQVLNPTVHYLSQLPAEIDLFETVFIVIMSLSLSILATLYPSWRAAQMDPIEALRYE
ncbi:MAG: lipoprotein-releasing ABC transporter permease subunit [Pseudomonadota bacterium]